MGESLRAHPYCVRRLLMVSFITSRGGANWVVSGLVLGALWSFVTTTRARAQEAQSGTNVVWIRKAIHEPNSGLLTSERHFRADYISPADVTERVGLSDTFPIERLDPQGRGTCTEYRFDLDGVNPASYFASAGFLPAGALDSASPFNVAEPLALGSGRRVVLKLDVRAKTTPSSEAAKIRFMSGGFSFGNLEDGVRFPQTTNPAPVVVRDRWQTLTIDLTRRSKGLDRVVNPLQVVVRANENTRATSIFVYIKDIRYEVVSAADSDR
jgi:hypothetical protein